MKTFANIKFSRNQIKSIAIFAMLLNHISYIFMDGSSFIGYTFTNIGYFTAITMCYFLVEGYFHTHSRKSYAKRLLIFAFISQFPFCLALTKNAIISFMGFNMMFSLFLCFILIYCHVNIINPFKRVFFSGIILILSCFCDWSFIAPAFTLFFLLAKEGRISKMKAFIYSALSFGAFNFISSLGYVPLRFNFLSALLNITAPIIAGIIITFFYDDTKKTRASKFSKWFFYVFYPAHLLILGMIRLYLMDLQNVFVTGITIL